MRSDCPKCSAGSMCATCLDTIHTVHLANGFERAEGCVRCPPEPANRAASRRARFARRR